MKEQPGRRCSICSSASLAEVNKKLIVENVPLRIVLSQFPEFSLGSLGRHSKNCLRRFVTADPQKVNRLKENEPRTPAELIDKREQYRSADPIEEMELDLRKTSETARRDGDHRLAVQADGLRMKLFEVRERLRDRAKTQDDGTKQQAMRVLASLPDGFVKRLRDGDSEAMGTLLSASEPVIKQQPS
jgi:hypothetical protein